MIHGGLVFIYAFAKGIFGGFETGKLHVKEENEKRPKEEEAQKQMHIIIVRNYCMHQAHMSQTQKSRNFFRQAGDNHKCRHRSLLCHYRRSGKFCQKNTP